MALLQNILAMVIFGTIGLFVKEIPLSSPMIAFLRTCIGALVLGGLLLLRHQKVHIHKGEGRHVLVSACFLGCNWVFLFEGYRYTSVSNATMIYYLAPVLILLYSILVYHQRVHKRLLISFGLCVSGFLLVSAQASAIGAKGILFSLLAALGYAGVVIINRKIHMDALPFTFVQLSIASLILLPYLIITKDFTQLSTLSLSTIPWIVTLGVVHTGLAYVLYFSSITGLSPSKVAIFSYLDPGTAILISCLILQESMSAMQWLGILGIALGLLYAQKGSESDVLSF